MNIMKSKIFVPNKGISVDFGESKIFTISDGIYKEFKDNISQNVRRRKKERLKYLEQFEFLKPYYPEIEYFVEYLRGLYIKGYVMKEVNTKNLDSLSIEYENKLEILKKLKELLDLFRSIGLNYYDIHLDNVRLHENGLPFLYDMDSILFIDEKNPDIVPYGYDCYRWHNGKLDEGFQKIKFNILTRNILCYHKDFACDEIGQEMLDYQLNVFNPDSPFAREYLFEHTIKK